MVKNTWSNPELKELSIENTLQPTPYVWYDVWVCNECGKEYREWRIPDKCYNLVLKDWHITTCGSTNFTKREDCPGGGAS